MCKKNKGYGPGKGTGVGGGGNGGSGGVVGGDGGAANGLVDTPLNPGSGGGIGNNTGGSGGGAVLIQAGGAVTINGTIAANGGNATHQAGGAAGGSVFIQCATFGGLTNGLISVAGGDGCWWEGYLAYLGGGGGGGRIAVDYDSLAGNHAVRFVASKGPDNANLPSFPHMVPRGAEMGTLWLPDAALLSETMTDRLFTDVRLVIPGFSTWSVDSLSVSNCAFVFDQPLVLTVTNNLHIARGSLGMRGDVAVQNGNLELAAGGGLYLYALPTNGASPGYGALLGVGGDVRVASNAWIYPIADRTSASRPPTPSPCMARSRRTEWET